MACLAPFAAAAAAAAAARRPGSKGYTAPGKTASGAGSNKKKRGGQG